MTAKVLMSVLVVGLVTSACAGEQSRDSGGRGPGTIEVQAEEYKFGGVPETMPRGVATFVLENVGQEPHEFGLAEITGDQPIEELVRLPEDESMEFIRRVGGTFAEPGQEASFRATLPPGRYGYVCFVETEGKPHAARGMYGEFTVEEA
jgi:plastocyanin